MFVKCIIIFINQNIDLFNLAPDNVYLKVGFKFSSTHFVNSVGNMLLDKEKFYYRNGIWNRPQNRVTFH